jgi:AcrR family transcriptional regulator
MVGVREPSGAAVGTRPSSYSSVVRANQARATRRAIVTAAAALFVERGYAATTIDAVAERAGVGRKTVFSSVGGKGALLKQAWDWVIAGDDEPVPMSERPAVRAIIAEHEPRRMVRMWVDMVLDVGCRAWPLGAVVLAAADVDAEARALQDLIHRESLDGATAFVTHLAGAGALRAGLSVEQGADICWALINSRLLQLLVDARGWRPHEYGEWLVEAASATLLEPQGNAVARRAPAVRTIHNPARQRYEASVDGRDAGYLAYERTEGLVVLIRTEVDRDFDDCGVADALVRTALDGVRADGRRRVIALCPYVTWWLGRHPDHAALVYDTTAG